MPRSNKTKALVDGRKQVYMGKIIGAWGEFHMFGSKKAPPQNMHRLLMDLLVALDGNNEGLCLFTMDELNQLRQRNEPIDTLKRAWSNSGDYSGD